MPNLFDGQDGRSDGTTNGSSLELSGTGPINLHCFGVFDGATVTLERYSESESSFAPTDLTWTDVAQYQGLYLTVYSTYRLTISDAGASTAIIVERA